jgi:hypothetical protein
MTGDAKRFVQFSIGKRPVGRGDSAEHVGVQVDFIQGDAVVNTKIQLPRNRAHLHR